MRSLVEPFFVLAAITDADLACVIVLLICISCNQFEIHLVLATEATYRPFFNT